MRIFPVLSKINVSRWDQYPSIFSAAILPAIWILVLIRNVMGGPIFDDYSMIRIAFVLALCALGFTFWCKWKEDNLPRKREKLKTQIQSLTKLLVHTHAPAEFLKMELKKIEEQINKAETELQETERKIGEAKANIVKEKQTKIRSRLKNSAKVDYEKYVKILNKIESIGKEEKETKEEDKAKTSSGQLLIFAALYAIVGGLAVTQALTVFSDPDRNEYVTYVHNLKGFVDLLLSKHTFVIASFFSVAVLFIHCGIVFLSSDAKKILIEGNKVGLFIGSLLLFLEGVVLYYASNAVDNILNFSFWIFLLMVIDIVWVIVNILKNIDMLFQWLHLDAIMLSFLLTILIMFQSLSQITLEVYVYVLVIFLARTITDYKMGWKTVWGKFDVSEKWT
ncbi:MAG: hypothetical protein HY295_01495 [Thaumarchaeota archaeon]|nr:hypothetical protein [Nitrososphaerota archaeon]